VKDALDAVDADLDRAGSGGVHSSALDAARLELTLRREDGAAPYRKVFERPRRSRA